MEKVLELVKTINENRTQESSSQKDEISVMKAMVNDREFKVDIYSKNGKEGEYCPAEDIRSMVGNVISSAAKIPSAEAQKLADEYDFKKSDAVTLVGVSKEFVNTYLQTGRKLPLGGRATSNISLIKKDVEETKRTYPQKVGVDDNGKGIYVPAETTTKAHTSARVIGSCPEWLK